MGCLWILCKKLFSLSLVFNALLTAAGSAGILGGLYLFFSGHQPFYPYLVNGNIFWVAIAAALLNIFPSASLGRALKTGRLFFHHYFYGFLVLLFSTVYVAVFTPVSLFSLFLIDNSSIAVNAGRVFILGGSTLILDDLPDVSYRVELTLNWLKAKAHRWGRVLSVAQVVTGAVSLYIFAAIFIGMLQNLQWVTLANLILICTLFITGVTSFIFVKKRAWQRM